MHPFSVSCVGNRADIVTVVLRGVARPIELELPGFSEHLIPACDAQLQNHSN